MRSFYTVIRETGRFVFVKVDNLQENQLPYAFPVDMRGITPTGLPVISPTMVPPTMTHYDGLTQDTCNALPDYCNFDELDSDFTVWLNPELLEQDSSIEDDPLEEVYSQMHIDNPIKNGYRIKLTVDGLDDVDIGEVIKIYDRDMSTTSPTVDLFSSYNHINIDGFTTPDNPNYSQRVFNHMNTLLGSGARVWLFFPSFTNPQNQTEAPNVNSRRGDGYGAIVVVANEDMESLPENMIEYLRTRYIGRSLVEAGLGVVNNRYAVSVPEIQDELRFAQRIAIDNARGVWSESDAAMQTDMFRDGELQSRYRNVIHANRVVEFADARWDVADTYRIIGDVVETRAAEVIGRADNIVLEQEEKQYVDAMLADESYIKIGATWVGGKGITFDLITADIQSLILRNEGLRTMSPTIIDKATRGSAAVILTVASEKVFNEQIRHVVAQQKLSPLLPIQNMTLAGLLQPINRYLELYQSYGTLDEDAVEASEIMDVEYIHEETSLKSAVRSAYARTPFYCSVDDIIIETIRGKPKALRVTILFRRVDIFGKMISKMKYFRDWASMEAYEEWKVKFSRYHQKSGKELKLAAGALGFSDEIMDLLNVPFSSVSRNSSPPLVTGSDPDTATNLHLIIDHRHGEDSPRGFMLGFDHTSKEVPFYKMGGFARGYLSFLPTTVTPLNEMVIDSTIFSAVGNDNLSRNATMHLYTPRTANTNYHWRMWELGRVGDSTYYIPIRMTDKYVIPPPSIPVVNSGDASTWGVLLHYNEQDPRLSYSQFLVNTLWDKRLKWGGDNDSDIIKVVGIEHRDLFPLYRVRFGIYLDTETVRSSTPSLTGFGATAGGPVYHTTEVASFNVVDDLVDRPFRRLVIPESVGVENFWEGNVEPTSDGVMTQAIIESGDYGSDFAIQTSKYTRVTPIGGSFTSDPSPEISNIPGSIVFKAGHAIKLSDTAFSKLSEAMFYFPSSIQVEKRRRKDNELFTGDNASYEDSVIDIKNSFSYPFSSPNDETIYFDMGIGARVVDHYRTTIGYSDIPVANVGYVPLTTRKGENMVFDTPSYIERAFNYPELADLQIDRENILTTSVNQMGLERVLTNARYRLNEQEIYLIAYNRLTVGNREWVIGEQQYTYVHLLEVKRDTSGNIDRDNTIHYMCLLNGHVSITETGRYNLPAIRDALERSATEDEVPVFVPNATETVREDDNPNRPADSRSTLEGMIQDALEYEPPLDPTIEDDLTTHLNHSEPYLRFYKSIMREGQGDDLLEIAGARHDIMEYYDEDNTDLTLTYKYYRTEVPEIIGVLLGSAQRLSTYASSDVEYGSLSYDRPLNNTLQSALISTNGRLTLLETRLSEQIRSEYFRYFSNTEITATEYNEPTAEERLEIVRKALGRDVLTFMAAFLGMLTESRSNTEWADIEGSGTTFLATEIEDFTLTDPESGEELELTDYRDAINVMKSSIIETVNRIGGNDGGAQANAFRATIDRIKTFQENMEDFVGLADAFIRVFGDDSIWNTLSCFNPVRGSTYRPTVDPGSGALDQTEYTPDAERMGDCLTASTETYEIANRVISEDGTTTEDMELHIDMNEQFLRDFIALVDLAQKLVTRINDLMEMFSASYKTITIASDDSAKNRMITTGININMAGNSATPIYLDGIADPFVQVMGGKSANASINLIVKDIDTVWNLFSSIIPSTFEAYLNSMLYKSRTTRIKPQYDEYGEDNPIPNVEDITMANVNRIRNIQETELRRHLTDMLREAGGVQLDEMHRFDEPVRIGHTLLNSLGLWTFIIRGIRANPISPDAWDVKIDLEWEDTSVHMSESLILNKTVQSLNPVIPLLIMIENRVYRPGALLDEVGRTLRSGRTEGTVDLQNLHNPGQQDTVRPPDTLAGGTITEDYQSYINRVQSIFDTVGNSYLFNADDGDLEGFNASCNYAGVGIDYIMGDLFAIYAVAYLQAMINSDRHRRGTNDTGQPMGGDEAITGLGSMTTIQAEEGTTISLSSLAQNGTTGRDIQSLDTPGGMNVDEDFLDRIYGEAVLEGYEYESESLWENLMPGVAALGVYAGMSSFGSRLAHRGLSRLGIDGLSSKLGSFGRVAGKFSKLLKGGLGILGEFAISAAFTAGLDGNLIQNKQSRIISFPRLLISVAPYFYNWLLTLYLTDDMSYRRAMIETIVKKALLLLNYVMENYNTGEIKVTNAMAPLRTDAPSGTMLGDFLQDVFGGDQNQSRDSQRIRGFGIRSAAYFTSIEGLQHTNQLGAGDDIIWNIMWWNKGYNLESIEENYRDHILETSENIKKDVERTGNQDDSIAQSLLRQIAVGIERLIMKSYVSLSYKGATGLFDAAMTALSSSRMIAECIDSIGMRIGVPSHLATMAASISSMQKDPEVRANMDEAELAEYEKIDRFIRQAVGTSDDRVAIFHRISSVFAGLHGVRDQEIKNIIGRKLLLFMQVQAMGDRARLMSYIVPSELQDGSATHGPTYVLDNEFYVNGWISEFRRYLTDFRSAAFWETIILGILALISFKVMLVVWGIIYIVKSIVLMFREVVSSALLGVSFMRLGLLIIQRLAARYEPSDVISIVAHLSRVLSNRAGRPYHFLPPASFPYLISTMQDPYEQVDDASSAYVDMPVPKITINDPVIPGGRRRIATDPTFYVYKEIINNSELTDMIQNAMEVTSTYLIDPSFTPDGTDIRDQLQNRFITRISALVNEGLNAGVAAANEMRQLQRQLNDSNSPLSQVSNISRVRDTVRNIMNKFRGSGGDDDSRPFLYAELQNVAETTVGQLDAQLYQPFSDNVYSQLISDIYELRRLVSTGVTGNLVGNTLESIDRVKRNIEKWQNTMRARSSAQDSVFIRWGTWAGFEYIKSLMLSNYAVYGQLGKVMILRKMREGIGNLEKDDKTIPFFRAYPSFKLFFLQENTDEWILYDDMYSYSSVNSIYVTRSRKRATDLAVVSVNNRYNKLTNVIAARYNTESPFSVSKDAGEDINAIMLKPGAKVQIRMGYGNRLTMDNTVFNGEIVSINGTDVLEIVIQGHGVTLTQPLTEDKVISLSGLLATWLKSLYTFQNILVSIMREIPSRNLGGNAYFSSDYTEMEDVFRSVGMDPAQSLGAYVREEWYESLIGMVFGSSDTDEISEFFRETVRTTENVRVDEDFTNEGSVYKLFYIAAGFGGGWVVEKGRDTGWTSLTDIVNQIPNHCVSVQPYDLRGTVVVGSMLDGYYKYTDRHNMENSLVTQIVKELQPIIYNPAACAQLLSNKISTNNEGQNVLLSAMFYEVLGQVAKAFTGSTVLGEEDGLAAAFMLDRPDWFSSLVGADSGQYTSFTMVKDAVDPQRLATKLRETAINSAAFLARVSEHEDNSEWRQSYIWEESLDDIAANIPQLETLMNGGNGGSALGSDVQQILKNTLLFQYACQLVCTGILKLAYSVSRQHKKISETYPKMSGIHIIENNINLQEGFNEVLLEYIKHEGLGGLDEDSFRSSLYDPSNLDSVKLRASYDIRPDKIRTYTAFQKNGAAFDARLASMSLYVCASNILANLARDYYGGSLTIIGDARIKPWDNIFLVDEMRDMWGIVAVEEVTHLYDKQKGFISIIKPDLPAYTQLALEDYDLGLNVSKVSSFLAWGLSAAAIITFAWAAGKLGLRMAMRSSLSGEGRVFAKLARYSAVRTSGQIMSRVGTTRLWQWFGRRGVPLVGRPHPVWNAFKHGMLKVMSALSRGGRLSRFIGLNARMARMELMLRYAEDMLTQMAKTVGKIDGSAKKLLSSKMISGMLDDANLTARVTNNVVSRLNGATGGTRYSTTDINNIIRTRLGNAFPSEINDRAFRLSREYYDEMVESACARGNFNTEQDIVDHFTDGARAARETLVRNNSSTLDEMVEGLNTSLRTADGTVNQSIIDGIMDDIIAQSDGAIARGAPEALQVRREIYDIVDNMINDVTSRDSVVNMLTAIGTTTPRVDTNQLIRNIVEEMRPQLEKVVRRSNRITRSREELTGELRNALQGMQDDVTEMLQRATRRLSPSNNFVRDTYRSIVRTNAAVPIGKSLFRIGGYMAGAALFEAYNDTYQMVIEYLKTPQSLTLAGLFYKGEPYVANLDGMKKGAMKGEGLFRAMSARIGASYEYAVEDVTEQYVLAYRQIQDEYDNVTSR